MSTLPTGAQTPAPMAFKAICDFIEFNGGIKITEEKAYLLDSRLSPLMRELKCTDYLSLLNKASADLSGQIRIKIVDAMTTNETLWFRDGGPFEMLAEYIIPELVKNAGNATVRIWSAACSSGQEPYSLAILIHELKFKNPSVSPGRFEIIATDLSPTILESAAKGVYDGLAIGRGLSQNLRDKYFNAEGKNWRVRDEIKKMVSFKHFNLKDNYGSLGKFDLIMCRNVLIYFSDTLKKDIMERQARALNPGGVYMVGASESVSNYTQKFVMKNYKNSIYYQTVPV